MNACARFGDRRNGSHVRVVPSRMHEGRSANARIRARTWRFMEIYCTHTGSRQPIRYSAAAQKIQLSLIPLAQPAIAELLRADRQTIPNLPRAFIRGSSIVGCALDKGIGSGGRTAGARGAWSCRKTRLSPQTRLFHGFVNGTTLHISSCSGAIHQFS